MRVGIDFGTSNTSVALLKDGAVSLVEIEPGEVSIPTAIFYETGQPGCVIGNAALEAYESGEDGRLMRSIKSVLGSELIEETTQIGSRSMPFRQVILDFLRTLLKQVEKQAGGTITDVVQGRPVSFNDTNKAFDARAQRVLEDCLKELGVQSVEFLTEPVAAARSVAFQAPNEHLAFVIDIGGGTSDFSVVRIEPGKNGFQVLGSSGVYVGGNDFDRLLSFFELTPLFGRTETLELNGLPAPAAPYVTLSDWKSLNRLYAPAVKKEVAWMQKHSPSSLGIRALSYLIENFEAATYAHKTEAAKIRMSSDDEARFTYPIPGAKLEKLLIRSVFENLIAETISTMDEAAHRCLSDAGVKPSDITDIIMVGGSTFVPTVEMLFLKQFPNAKLTDNDRFGAVAKGLARHAAN